MNQPTRSGPRSTHQNVGLWLGVGLFAAMFVAGPPEDLSRAGWMTASIGVLMAVWWATEAVPIAVTSLLPVAAFSMLGISGIQDAASPYANKVIFLFLGGFVVALAMQRWNLHRRIALKVLRAAGGGGRSLIGAFMLASALISMWVTNTSTAMMLLPIAMSVITVIHNSVGELDQRGRRDFECALLLGVAYGSTIGGMATLIGTPPNALFAAFMSDEYGTDIHFANWFLIGLPLAAAMLPLAWLTLTRLAFRVDFRTGGEGRAELDRMLDEMGPMSLPEKRVAIVFTIMALAWVFQPFLVRIPALAGLDDSGIAMAGAIAMFLVPSRDPEDPMLMRWRYTEKLPWGVLLLFGGGLSLAHAVSQTGLAEWLGTSLQSIATLPPAAIVFIVAGMIILLTELTSNTATTATFLPIVGAIAIEAGFDPVLLAVPVTLAASCAFMLPVATPPNAVVFGAGLLTIPKMARAGLVLNVFSIVLVSLVAIYLAPRVL